MTPDSVLHADGMKKNAAIAMGLDRRACLRLMGQWAALGCSGLAGCGGALNDNTGTGQGKSEAVAPYAEAMREAMGSVGKDLKGYYFRSTPVGNFGVGSLYLDDINDPGLARVESGWYLGGPESWLASKLKPAERQAWLKRLIAEGTLGQLKLDEGQARSMQARTGISLLTVLTAHANVDHRKGVRCALQVAEVRDRRLNWAQFEAAMAAGAIAPTVAKVVNDNRFIVAAADLALIGYRAEFQVNEELNPGLSVALRKNVLPEGGGRLKVDLQLREASRGHFIISSNSAVVAAMLFKRPPPRSKALGATLPALDAWPSADIRPAAMDRLEAQGG